jgi:tetratricopeptide (TPR) repeat protein
VGQGSGFAKVTAGKGEIELPTYPWAAVKHPYFRGTDKVNIYPYPMLDFLSREKTNRTYRTVVLENEYLRITFLPELGGKIHEVLDKTTGQPMFYVNHVVKPGLIGQCGAWTSGGVEWNTGPQGHTVSCMQPIPVAILPAQKDGSRSVAIGETERIYGTRWTVIVTLRPGRAFIEEHIRIYNPTETIRPYYFWNCTAAPNTPGFRFIYPMTLGCDHAGDKFFQWPVDHGKDLSRGTNYEDASSIFAWHCDQDFFGSYNDDLNHGVVSYANHQQLPGKKAWTWGHGGFGTMHQRDLTDDDGPYNEVQTGPLLTQAQVGWLDPCQAVEWNEWWYPVHDLGGFTFANHDVAVNAELQENGEFRLRMLGTATWRSVAIEVTDGKTWSRAGTCDLSPAKVTERTLAQPGGKVSAVTLSVEGRPMAHFEVPLAIPARKPPKKKNKPQTASEFVFAGWQEYLFAHYAEAEKLFRQALDQDPKTTEARLGLAFLSLERDPAEAAVEAESALVAAPDDGLARFALASAQARLGQVPESLDNAWLAARRSETAVGGRALAAKLLLRAARAPIEVEHAVAGPGPWETDVVCRGRRALAALKHGDIKKAVALANLNLEVEPLDSFSHALLWLANREKESPRLEELVGGKAEAVVELVTQFVDLGERPTALRLLKELYFDRVPAGMREPLPGYWAGALTSASSTSSAALDVFQAAEALPARAVFPYQSASIEMLRHAVEVRPNDGKASLYLGHLLFHLGRFAEGRELWERAAALNAEPVIAYRALGMAAKTLDGDLKSARAWLEKANQADPNDAIVARDLANVLSELADQATSETEQRDLFAEARDKLKVAFSTGRGRSDFVALLARGQNRLGEYEHTTRMLDGVRVTVWEGSHELHDLFEQAHLAVGEQHLKAGRPTEALAEFDRALEYPANLATGKLENSHQAHIQYLRGSALAALGRKPEARAAWKLAAEEPESKDARINEARRKANEALAR